MTIEEIAEKGCLLENCEGCQLAFRCNGGIREAKDLALVVLESRAKVKRKVDTIREAFDLVKEKSNDYGMPAWKWREVKHKIESALDSLKYLENWIDKEKIL